VRNESIIRDTNRRKIGIKCAFALSWLSVRIVPSSLAIAPTQGRLEMRLFTTMLIYRTTALIVCDLARKIVQILGFSAPVSFRGHSEEIAIAKVLLNTKPRRVGEFGEVGFPTSEKVWREKN